MMWPFKKKSAPTPAPPPKKYKVLYRDVDVMEYEVEITLTNRVSKVILLRSAKKWTRVLSEDFKEECYYHYGIRWRIVAGTKEDHQIFVSPIGELPVYYEALREQHKLHCHETLIGTATVLSEKVSHKDKEAYSIVVDDD